MRAGYAIMAWMMHKPTYVRHTLALGVLLACSFALPASAQLFQLDFDDTQTEMSCKRSDPLPPAATTPPLVTISIPRLDADRTYPTNASSSMSTAAANAVAVGSMSLTEAGFLARLSRIVRLKNLYGTIPAYL